MRSCFVIVGQKISFYALSAIFNKILLFFYMKAAAISPSIMNLATSIIKEDPRISSMQYQQSYTLSLIQAAFSALLLKLVSIAKNKTRNRSTSCKRLYSKQELEIWILIERLLEIRI